MINENETWTIGEAEVNELPIVCKFLTELPDEQTRANLTLLTIIAWEYDGSDNNGMPDDQLDKSMSALEDAIETLVGNNDSHMLAYTQSGSNLKEFVFYISDQDQFMQTFNDALEGQPAHPLKIDSYEDPEWSDLKKLQADFQQDAE